MQATQDTQVGHPLVGAVLPYVDGENKYGNVTMYTLQDRGACGMFGNIAISLCLHRRVNSQDRQHATE